jgi:hypothetical protein
MLRSEAIRILEVVRKEQQEDMTQRDLNFWSLAPDGTLSLDNHTFMNYNDLIEYLELQLENTSGGFGDDFA